MQDQTRRDEKTLQIFTGVVIFVAVLGGGWIVVALSRQALGVPDDVANALLVALVAVAMALTVAYLVRQKRGQ